MTEQELAAAFLAMRLGVGNEIEKAQDAIEGHIAALSASLVAAQSENAELREAWSAVPHGLVTDDLAERWREEYIERMRERIKAEASLLAAQEALRQLRYTANQYVNWHDPSVKVTADVPTQSDALRELRALLGVSAEPLKDTERATASSRLDGSRGSVRAEA